MEIPILKSSKERLNVLNKGNNLPRERPDIVDTIYDQQIISFNLQHLCIEFTRLQEALLEYCGLDNMHLGKTEVISNCLEGFTLVISDDDTS